MPRSWVLTSHQSGGSNIFSMKGAECGQTSRKAKKEMFKYFQFVRMKSLLEVHMQEVPDVEHADSDVVERWEAKFKVL